MLTEIKCMYKTDLNVDRFYPEYFISEVYVMKSKYLSKAFMAHVNSINAKIFDLRGTATCFLNYRHCRRFIMELRQ